MKKEDFCAFAAAALSIMDDKLKTEYWGTERNILDDLLSQAKSSLFGKEIKDEAEYAKYLKLKAKFEASETNVQETWKKNGWIPPQKGESK
jgi:hypothetical protein